ncbi:MULTISPECIES: hypothetical protein [Olivibacter]|jgi:DNA repair exonuclease SbcCD ATPase subunit|uniref:Uncharacterized protein n=2 Tax=Olivibacter TaxID=376469 RepID=A0ABV6HLQ7_9SPHI|nr:MULTISPECIES: hypothetical protein [Olivibacter]MCL4641610.1 hypothetical protein [Olivibacter sp. UJ_SKK_5.1]MDX3914436.1 hypothetical protein [Pseudosphingobacterium sp.]QEL02558.1 hypothetical protein FKG96_17630 [Olivibacter sp. LS-1]
MKTLLIVALLGTSVLSAQASALVLSDVSHVGKIEEKKSEAEELKQKVEVQLYNLNMLNKQFKMAQEAIKNSKGSHKDIDKDFEYFHSLLLEDSKTQDNAKEIDESVQRLKKEYARKHKNRAAYELKEQKSLATSMQKELNSHIRECKSLKAKYKKYLDGNVSPELRDLETKLEETEKILKESTESNIQNATYYDRKLEDIKKV